MLMANGQWLMAKPFAASIGNALLQFAIGG
jgi:hypothetical protein